MYSKYSIISTLFLNLILVNFSIKTTALPIDSKTSSFYRNIYESSPTSSSNSNEQQRLEVKSEISDTVSKILRLMHSLSNKSVLIEPKEAIVSDNNTPNFNYNSLKEDNLKLRNLVESKIETDAENNHLNNQSKERPISNKLNHKKLIHKYINDRTNTENLKERAILNERFNDRFNEGPSNENSNENLLDKFRNKYTNSDLTKEFTLSSKYPTTNSNQQDDNQQKKLAAYDYSKIESMPKSTDQIIRQPFFNEDESIKSMMPLIFEKYPRFTDTISRSDNLNKEKDSSKSMSKDQIEHFDDLQITKKHQKNLHDYFMENQEEIEDNQNEEDATHMHTYNISQINDDELNRALMDITWLLNQNLNNKQEIETKFSSKGRNNRNKIAQRIQYFDELYRNLHTLPNSTNKDKRGGEGPQLSVVSPLDILRDKLILEMARRKIEASKEQIKSNEDLLKKIG